MRLNFVSFLLFLSVQLFLSQSVACILECMYVCVCMCAYMCKCASRSLSGGLGMCWGPATTTTTTEHNSIEKHADRRGFIGAAVMELKSCLEAQGTGNICFIPNMDLSSIETCNGVFHRLTRSGRRKMNLYDLYLFYLGMETVFFFIYL